VCQFIVNHAKGCKPSTGKIIGVPLRSYLRFRGMLGDCVQTLMVPMSDAQKKVLQTFVWMNDAIAQRLYGKMK
jgi:hypothetical protein